MRVQNFGAFSVQAPYLEMFCSAGELLDTHLSTPVCLLTFSVRNQLLICWQAQGARLRNCLPMAGTPWELMQHPANACRGASQLFGIDLLESA